MKLDDAMMVRITIKNVLDIANVYTTSGEIDKLTDEQRNAFNSYVDAVTAIPRTQFESCHEYNDIVWPVPPSWFVI